MTQNAEERAASDLAEWERIMRLLDSGAFEKSGGDSGGDGCSAWVEHDDFGIVTCEKGGIHDGYHTAYINSGHLCWGGRYQPSPDSKPRG